MNLSLIRGYLNGRSFELDLNAASPMFQCRGGLDMWVLSKFHANFNLPGYI